MPSIDFTQIQGNIFGGFNKDHQTFLFLQFMDGPSGRAWIKGIAADISSSAEVMAFNTAFKLVEARHGKEPGIIKATWMNLAFSFNGLKALEVPDAEIGLFPQAYQDGMAARANIIQDSDASAPENWVAGFGSQNIHAVLLIAADSPDDLKAAVANCRSDIASNGTINIIFQQEGLVRQDDSGHEHFGFKDGVSQPGIRGVDVPDDPTNNPNQGHPGQDLLWPGEFVLGYETQIPTPDPTVDGPNPNPGPISQSGPAWTQNGSYLVFRRLRQDVKKFQDAIAILAMQQDLSPDLVGAKLVGRYKSGCPLEMLKSNPGPYVTPSVDPGIADPGLASSDALNNFFEFQSQDADGHNLPRAAHIRKAYPRDEVGAPGSSSESETQTHRLLRRGVPFGNSLGAAKHGEADVKFPHDRGLLFLCYQNDLENHFEFVQSAWINNVNFPQANDGQDPLISQSASGPFVLSKPDGTITPVSGGISHFVTTTGGEYFFQPSISALYHIAQTNPPANP